MGLGFALYLFPGWEGALRAGFWLTLTFAILHIYTSHKNTPEES